METTASPEARSAPGDPPTPGSTRWDAIIGRRRAIGAMFLCGVCFALMGALAKLLGTRDWGNRPIPSGEVAFFRFLFGFLALLPLQGRWGIRLLGTDRWGLVWRGVTGAAAIVMYFVAIQMTTLTHAVLLNYTFVVFTPVVAWIVLRERLTGRGGIAVLVATTGTVLVIHPRWGGGQIGDLIALGSGMLSSVAVVIVRRLRASESAITIFFYLCMIGAPTGLVLAMFQGPRAPSYAGWLILLLMGAAATVGQLMMTYAYKYLDTTRGNLITLTTVLYTALLGTLFFGESLRGQTVVGGLMILGACAMMG